jgi:IS5 family transposase
MVKLAKEHGVNLRRNYNLVARQELRKISGYLHAKQMKRARKAIKHFKTLVGRVTRDCERQVAGNELLSKEFRLILSQANHLLTRKVSDKNKLYSLHEPDVVCISKGKARNRYEFGCKVSLGITHKKGTGIIVTAKALSGNPYDGHTLKKALQSAATISGTPATKAFVDKGYKGHEVNDCKVFISGQRRGITASIKNK